MRASWFDTRDSPTSNAQYDVFVSFAANKGTSFAPNSLVTMALVNAGSASFVGDYSGNAASGGFAQPTWTSGGFNNGLLQTATPILTGTSRPVVSLSTTSINFGNQAVATTSAASVVTITNMAVPR